MKARLRKFPSLFLPALLLGAITLTGCGGKEPPAMPPMQVTVLEATPRDIIICDDGLQHYALQRDLELALIDAARGHGNGWCLPAGPLRETAARLKQVDAVLYLGENAEAGYSLSLTPGRAYRLLDPSDTRSLDSFRNEAVHDRDAIAELMAAEGYAWIESIGDDDLYLADWASVR